MTTLNEIRDILNKSNQGHLLKFWNNLNKEEQDKFIKHLNSINFDDVTQLFNNAIKSVNNIPDQLDKRMKPIPPTKFESQERTGAKNIEKYKEIGLKEISEGHVAVLLLAGGQGTRLGVTYPKGMYSVGLPSGKTLFQIQAERIRRICKLAEESTGRKGTITWYIMTSGPTNTATEKFLKAHNYFGLNPNDVILFRQGLLPCFDFDGKIILEDKNLVAMAPDGNGGVYRAMYKNGILDDMTKRGIKYVHVHNIDNILVKVADPIFMGYCISKNANCGAKVVRKTSPNEAVGVVCQVDDKFQVVEYSEITETTANLRDDNGDLVFSAGNICNHFFTTTFLKEIAEKHEIHLKLHVAKKKIQYINDEGECIKPAAPNGIKIEKFVFDVFEFSNNSFVTWEVPRYSEFSALKNTDSAKQDCPMTARRDLLNLHKIYIKNAGGEVLSDVEISPLLSYSGENLEDKVKGRTFTEIEQLKADEENIINGFNH